MIFFFFGSVIWPSVATVITCENYFLVKESPFLMKYKKKNRWDSLLWLKLQYLYIKMLDFYSDYLILNFKTQINRKHLNRICLPFIAPKTFVSLLFPNISPIRLQILFFKLSLNLCLPQVTEHGKWLLLCCFVVMITLLTVFLCIVFLTSDAKDMVELWERAPSFGIRAEAHVDSRINSKTLEARTINFKSPKRCFF